jgi:hypothetical protein
MLPDRRRRFRSRVRPALPKPRTNPDGHAEGPACCRVLTGPSAVRPGFLRRQPPASCGPGSNDVGMPRTLNRPAAPAAAPAAVVTPCGPSLRTEPVPEGEQALQLRQPPTPCLRLTTAAHRRLEVPLQMGVTKRPSLRGKSAIRRPAVGPDDAGERLPQQCRQCCAPASDGSTRRFPAGVLG